MPPPRAIGDLNNHLELSARRSPPTSVMQVIVLHLIPSLKFVGLPVTKIWLIFLVTALIRLVTLTFDLSTSKWGHKSPVSCASFLPNFVSCAL